MKSRATGFTLIELLIVVAIIAILAAIAVPNFLEAQTRAKVSRVKADMRSMGTAMESYVIDNNTYVYQNALQRAIRIPGKVNTETLERLTTPIAYLAGVTSFRSPFPAKMRVSGGNLANGPNPLPDDEVDFSQIYWYNARNHGNNGEGASIWRNPPASDPKPTWWYVHSAGPAGVAYQSNDAVNSMTNPNAANKIEVAYKVMYDATNGTVSQGAIWRVGGSPTHLGKRFFEAISSQMR